MEHVKNALQNITTQWMPHSVCGSTTRKKKLNHNTPIAAAVVCNQGLPAKGTTPAWIPSCSVPPSEEAPRTRRRRRVGPEALVEVSEAAGRARRPGALPEVSEAAPEAGHGSVVSRLLV